MPNRSSKKRLRDSNQLANFFVDLVTGNPITEDISPIARKEKNPAAGALGGKARAGKLSAEKRRSKSSE